ncbi:MAG: hypothetical protein NC253_02370 [Ruminococcus sp.]|nr:hypothetical protein [Ruminococcus sp.]MCM1382618.1 hypothetical protein [Muribaculaceae bacterium]MCM1480688.1 hypothetical protein [Muribaculaceae bacterium]
MEKNLPQIKYSIFGIIGSLCFGIGDWLLGLVDTAAVEDGAFYYIRAGHGADYSTAKLAVVFALAMVGMLFLQAGLTRVSDIGKTEKTKRVLEYILGLCAAACPIIHFIVAAQVFIFSQTDKFGGRELAVTLSGGFADVSTAAFYGAYLFVFAGYLAVPIAIIAGKTYLKKSAAIFTPLVPMTIISEVREMLPDTPFAYGLFTFCMNFGMIVWFIYLICANKKLKRSAENG